MNMVNIDLFGGYSRPLTQNDKAEISQFTPYKCSDATKQLLDRMVTPEEIKQEVFALPLSKSPGPDGFTGEFLRKSWSIVGEDFTSAVLEFFRSGKILKQWNCTAITLVPKKTGAERISAFRPIACCNVVYKVISKILARRLEKLLPTMISNSQSAFVKGRLLVENVLLATELVQGFNHKSITSRGLLQVDLRKAFDSVSWDFIIHVLQSFGFPPLYINWIRQCITTPSFSITVNGDLCGFFQGKKGLRQGDPISPFLFVMAMEVFGEMLKSKYASNDIGYHPLGLNPAVTHLAFADDVMIFFDGAAPSPQGISDTLHHFHHLSGLAMNRDKTTIFLAGLKQHEMDIISNFGFRYGSMPIRYLGLPLLHRKLRKADYSPLIDKISLRLQHWTTRTLSFAGRLQLITSVIYSLVNFWLSAFTLPKGCLKAIQSLCVRFLWAGNMDKNASAKVAWKNICLPKEEGGLGLRDFAIWNKALNLRLLWMIIAGVDSLWVAWNTTHRLSHANVWAVEATTNSSWIWKNLMALRPIAKTLTTCKLGDGKRASFWYDSWTSLGPLIDFVGADGPRKLGVTISSNVADATRMHQWRLPSARTRSPELLTLRHTLLAMPVPLHSRGPDCFKWGPPTASRSTTFSTKLAWEHIRPTASKPSWAKVVWFKGAVPRHAFTFWTANLNRLPVRTRLASWGMNISPLCCLCNLHDETRDHLFLHCEFSEQFWGYMLRRLGLPTFIFQDWNTLISWLATSSHALPSKLKLMTSQAAIYSIWRERNSRLFNQTSISPSALYIQLDRSIRDLLLARRTRKGCSRLLARWFAYS
ncbi:putative ribonuclease H protein [Cardamine amara subsp. amara]|uniref:Ribonuclease H protein n=1 Tax=Cardamine amara subsp. amara TaxID=228776 RepID=A0ABD1C8E2_CARAN